MSDPNELIIYQKIYDLILYSFPILNRFPKSQKFVLAQQIENSMISLGKLIVQANGDYNKNFVLKQADAELEILKLLVRLAKDLKFFQRLSHYENHSKRLEEIGRLLGGLQKKFR